MVVSVELIEDEHPFSVRVGVDGLGHDSGEVLLGACVADMCDQDPPSGLLKARNERLRTVPPVLELELGRLTGPNRGRN